MEPERGSTLQNRQSYLLSVFLWLGGVPPVLSGIVAALAPTWYLQAVGMEQLFAPRGYPAATFILSLQGGDAFVAGSARIIGAIYGNLAIKRLLGIVAIAHSCFELWLLPTTLMSWHANYPDVEPSVVLLVEVYAFIALHLVLVIGFTWALLLKEPSRENAV